MTNEKMKLHWVKHWAQLKKKADGKNCQIRENINTRKGVEIKKRRAQEAANLKRGLETKLEEGNRGYDLLKKMGYQEGKGLGKDNSGILQPLPLEVKTDRKGLGATKKVGTLQVQVKTELAPQPGKKQEKLPTPMQIDQQRQTIKEEKDPIAMQVDRKLVPIKTQMVVAKQIKTEIPSTTPQPAARTTRSKHSPIRAPEPSPPRLTAKINGQQKPPPEVNVKIETGIASTNATLATLINSDSSGDPKFLKSILDRFYSKIELMQLRLEAAAAANPQHGDNDLIVAKIRIGKDEPIPNHAFEYIRTELVGWIGVYQEQDMATPIFHSMVNQQRYISIVCENAYAFKCLDQCVDDIAQMKTMGVIRLFRSPLISSVIYCFDAIYEGIVRDPELFLIQIQKHKPKLNAEQWMIIDHEVFLQERKTYFMFLIDERSALELNFQYSSSFCICMQKLLFRNRGVVAEEYLN